MKKLFSNLFFLFIVLYPLIANTAEQEGTGQNDEDAIEVTVDGVGSLK